MRKNVLLLMAACMCISMCSSCRPSEDYTPDHSAESAADITVNEKTQKAWKDRLDRTAHISVRDVLPQMYEPEFQAELTNEEVKEFISLGDSLGDSLELSKGSLRMERFYRLTITDGSGNILDDWVVDAAGNTVNAEGYLVEGKALKTWRNKVEKEHGITYSLLSRAPGKEYFSLLPMAASGHLFENTGDPAIEGVKYDLSEEDLHELAALGYGITTDPERVAEPDIYYMLNIYDENGAGLYSFSADRQGRYFCNQYPVSGKGLEAFFHGLEKKNDLQKSKNTLIKAPPKLKTDFALINPFCD